MVAQAGLDAGENCTRLVRGMVAQRLDEFVRPDCNCAALKSLFYWVVGYELSIHFVLTYTIIRIFYFY